MMIAEMMLIEPVRTSSNNPPTAFGNPAAIPPKMMIEIPLPRPRSVICSPSHIRNIVPVTSVTTVVRRNSMPGSVTRPGWFSSAAAIPNAWKVASTTVKYRVYCVIFRCPACPSFFSASSCGETIASNCMMIDAEMYGMIPSAKIVKSAPPENMLNMPRMPPAWLWNSFAS